MPSQVQEFLTKANAVVNPPDAPPAPQDQPKVPFQTALKLDAAQEKKLIEHAFKRLRTISSEIGRDQTLSPTWWQNQTVNANAYLASQGLQASETFLGKRSRYDATFLNDVTWRPYTFGPESIFNTSNLSTPAVRRVCRQMIARAQNSFFGSDPWFSVDPAPVTERDMQDDAGRADRIEKFCRFKLHEANSKEDKERAIARALILGECAVKTSYVVRDQMFNVEAMVLHDVNGEPVRAGDGNLITQDDQFVAGVDGVGNATRVLARDGTTEEPLAPIWQNVPLDRRQILFEGARSEPIYYKDFLCPLTAPDVQQADCIVHLYDKAVMEFVDLIVKRGMIGDDVGERMDAARRMVALVKQLSDNNAQPKAGVTQEMRPNEHFSAPPSVESGGPVAEFAEFYLWYDANGDGVAENIMLICDRNTQAPIFYDHVANVTTDGLRPIEIVRINPVEGRWYGLGIMELFDSYQTQIDLLVNRWNYNQSASGRVILWTPTNTLEGDANPNLDMRFGKAYTKKPGMKAEDVVEVVNLNDTKFEQTHLMFQFFLQLLMNESGVSSPNDGQTAGLASSDLATGVNAVEQSGDELFRPVVGQLKGPLERLLNREIEVTLANLNPQEVYTFLEGDDLGIATLTPDDVRGLKFKTQITLTTHKNQERIQIGTAVTALVEKFYALLPEVQMRVASLYKRQVSALDPTVDVNTVIVPLIPAPMGGNVVPMEGAGGGNPELGKGPDNTQHAAQLGQKFNQQSGVSAPGGTPAGA